MLVIACLSQKGGVGKSTFARLIARTYAKAGWIVKIADFNIKQKTSVDWCAIRMSENVEPEIAAEAFTDIAKATKLADLDLLVMDGKPDSDTQTIAIAKVADLIVIPSGLSADDLVPQVRFANELKMRGIEHSKILFALNNATDSKAAITDAQNFVRTAGFVIAKEAIQRMTSYMNAQNQGRCIAETEFPKLNERAEALAQEIVDALNGDNVTPSMEVAQ